MIFLGIGHRSRVGKDTLAKFIIQYLRLNSSNLKITRMSFATKLKQICHELYGHLGLHDEDYYNEHGEERDKILSLIGLTPVQIWINFGTLVGREVYADTWVSYVINKAKGYDVVISPDVRFTNETKYIKDAGGYVFELENPRVPPRNSIAEQQLIAYKDWDERFINDGDLNKLMGIAQLICDRYVLKPQKMVPVEVPTPSFLLKPSNKEGAD